VEPYFKFVQSSNLPYAFDDAHDSLVCLEHVLMQPNDVRKFFDTEN